jgi:hypothetical protein
VLRRRRTPLEPVVLPSLDRLSGLIERVVELVDAVGDAKAVPAPEPVAEPPLEPAAAPAAPAGETGWLAFVSSAHGYRLHERPGPLPAFGATVLLDDVPHRVVKLGPSPLPGDRRRCAYVTGEDPREPERTSDA